jgi:hypothetical protein
MGELSPCSMRSSFLAHSFPPVIERYFCGLGREGLKADLREELVPVFPCKDTMDKEVVNGLCLLVAHEAVCRMRKIPAG